MRTLSLIFVFWMAFAGFAEDVLAKRVALVIGNNDYDSVTDLQKAVNDARAMGEALESVGFEVIRAENASRRM